MAGNEPRRLSRRQALRITAVTGVSLTLGGGLVAGLLRRAGLHRVSETRTRMGTLVTVTVVHPEVAAARAMVADAFNEMARLEDILSRHRQGTPVARLNAEGAVRDAPPELIEVMRRATEYSTLTGGAFDVTVAPPQLSVAIADPFAATLVSAGHSSVAFAGQLTTGAVVSTTEIV